MKLPRIAALALCLCVLLAAAVPFPETATQESRGGETPAEEHWTPLPAEATNPLVLQRVKRQSHLSLCRVCCNCCKNKGCGFCCRF